MGRILEVNGLKKYYKDGKNRDIKALDGISFFIEKGEILGIIGESGCGKSTLGKLILGLEKKLGGSIDFEGEDISRLLKRDRLGFRKNYQMIYQNPYDVFDRREKIEKILTSTLKVHSIGKNKYERLDIVREEISKSGFNPSQDFLNRYPHELSGGQLQRVAIIRSMMLRPKLIVADEPVSMLDLSIRADIINILLKLREKENTAIIFISHDIATTQYVSDRILVMYLGRIVEIGKTEEIIDNPKHPYTKALISNCGSIDMMDNVEKIRIEGEAPIPINTGKGCYFEPRCNEACDICKNNYPKVREVAKGHFVNCFNVR